MSAPHQQAVLAVLGDGACRRLDDIVALTADQDLPRKQVCAAACRLIDRGYLERREIGCYQLTDAGRAALVAGEVLTSGPRGPIPRTAPVAGSLRAKLWRAIRLRRKATLGELVRLASTGEEVNAKLNASRYLRVLARAGYLEPLARASDGKPTSNGLIRYALIRDTGLSAPIIRQRGGAWEVYDPNTQEVFACETRGRF